MTLKGTLACAVALLAIWLMYGQHPAKPVHHPADHVTAPAHHKTATHAPAKKG